MASSTYISENLTQNQLALLRLLDDMELDIFSLDELSKTLKGKVENINEMVENLVHKKLLARIERGKFCRTNFKDELVIGCHLVDDGCVSYWSALNKHGLTEQFPNTVFIQTTKQKAEKTVFGVKYQFVRVALSKHTGIKTQGFGNHRYKITEVEKTIVDCFDLPEYSGGYAELIRAFNEAKLNSEKLIEYCEAIHNIATTKRMGFLAELLNKKGLKPFIRFAKEKVNTKYNLFDTQGSDKGEFVNEWRLRLNISREEILDICNKVY
ncbi:MAG: type IV toxin-antitoxin system AbiEi family antitoxin domain-containing protein [Bacteroidia bacterium]